MHKQLNALVSPYSEYIICCKVLDSYLQLYTDLWSSVTHSYTMKFARVCIVSCYCVFLYTKKSNK